MKIFKILLFSILTVTTAFSQFGKNKVQYKNRDWYYVQTKHFDIYFTREGKDIADFAASAAEKALISIQTSFRYKINNRITFILTNSFNDFQETNTIDESIDEGIGGFTELLKNRVVVPFEGDYSKFRHVIHHELTHAVMNDYFFGGSIQNIISKNINYNIPLWFNEGMAEYQSLRWDKNTDMFDRDAMLNDYMPNINELDGYYAYRGGQSVFYYIYKKYGDEKIGEIMAKTRSFGNLEEAFKSSLGLKLEEFNERWKKDLKKMFYPDIARRSDPDEFAKRLTDQKNSEGGYYNTSPAISPQGDKIAFLTNRDIYFSVYIMNSSNGKIIKKLVQGNETNDFEDLNILTPGLTWSPDGKKIALSASSAGYDIIYVIDVESENKEVLPIKMDGIFSVSWSPDGKKLALIGNTPSQSDLYLYDLDTKQLKNLTNDYFSDSDPSWNHNSDKVFFVSDRGKYTDKIPDTLRIKNHDYSQKDIYYYDLTANKIVRITNTPNADETSPIVTPDGKEILFISDINGINNIYRKSIQDSSRAKAITNSLNGLYQLSLSKDGKKLALSAMYKGAYNIFMLNNPLDMEQKDSLEATLFVKAQHDIPKADTAKIIAKNKVENLSQNVTKVVSETEKNNNDANSFVFVTGQYESQKDTAISNYQFFNKTYGDTTKKKSAFDLTNNFDEDGNYKVFKYKVNFTPDIIYANAGYTTFYGLMGTTYLSFSDMLGNHRIVGTTSLQVDLKNSDYGLAYYYLKERIDWGFQAYHTARFAYLDRNGYYDLFRFRSYGGGITSSYPFDKFYRMEFGTNVLSVSSENLDDETEKKQTITYLIPSLSFVHDNTLYGYTSPIQGTRYNLTLFGSPKIYADSLSFYSIVADYRYYFRFWYDNSLVFRISGGYSGGPNAQRFFIGGTENWINRVFSNNPIPVKNASDFAFLTPALPLRGFDYAEKLGTKYGLVNLEYRFPLLGVVATRGLPLLFRNFLGVMFVDAGAAWDNNKDLKLFSKSPSGNLITQDLLVGTGFGTRMVLLGFLVRFDAGWGYYSNHFSAPKYYFSLGYDF